MDPNGELEMFTVEKIPMIKKIFRQADLDGSGSLDLEEFCDGLKDVFGTDSKEELVQFFYKIDTNCDGTVDLGELMEFLICSKEIAKRLAPKDVFSKSIKVTKMNHYKTIVQVIFCPFINSKASECEVSVQTGQKRTYQTGQYISISTDGILTYLSDKMNIISRIRLDLKEKTLPFSRYKKIHVTGMAFIKELEQMAVSTSEREVLFYSCNKIAELFLISHALVLEESPANAIMYGSNNNKSVLACGDVDGFLTVLIAHNRQEKYLFFGEKMFEKTSRRYYKTVNLSTLLKNTTENCHCVKIPIFNDICSQIKYFPSANSLSVCGSSAKKMVIVKLPKPPIAGLPKDIFESTGGEQFFNCVDYSPLTGFWLTGGKDGLLREWFHFSNDLCIRALAGHVKPITNITVNSKDQLVVSLSEDKNVRVWSEEEMLPLQSFQFEGMGNGCITSMHYNTYNNELVLANTNIGACLGKGTQVYQKALKSHDMPICGALYNSIYKQVISVCQNGVVNVSDVLTGHTTVRFNVTSEQHVGHTAIAFDEQQRRFITGSPDGRVRIWNFSNGKCLAIHPVTLPNEVTGLVCYNERVFVSVKNSKIIYDLNIDGYKNRFLKHDYLDDISSMDIHENTLISASSNGNILMWNIETAEAQICINGSKCAKTIWMTKSAQSQTGPIEKLTKKSGCTAIVKAWHLIKSLKTREVSSSTATLLSAADGYICAWSVHVKGGLLGKFKAVDEEGAVITTMTTDVQERLLLTGDSNGKIYQWDIQQFGFANQSNEGPYGEQYGWRWSLAQPPLLASWQCYAEDVVSFVCDNSCKKLITAGLDCYLHLWENTGSHVGVFGKDKWNAKELNLEEHWEEENERLPITSTRKTETSHTLSNYSSSKRGAKIQQGDTLKKGVLKPCPPSTQPERHQTKLTPHPPPRLEHGSFTPNRNRTQSGLNQTRINPLPTQKLSEYISSKGGRGVKIQQGDTLKKGVLKPCPPSTQPWRHQTKLTPQPPQTLEHGSFPPNRKRTQSPLLTQKLSEYISFIGGRGVKIQQGDTLKKGVVKPCPPSTQPGRHQTKLTPHPPPRLEHGSFTPNRNRTQSPLPTQKLSEYTLSLGIIRPS
ncbi:WD repeat-containing protein on Y chromosome-like [Pungitius pungitius]|uniref:WD repeat-containing protein on Y chromosome-like n=1 Tax=Pungitius pungitius TaxID=134920 RepID=UPI002E13FD70